MNKPTKARIEESFPRFLKSVGRQTDPVMMLLRAHLYSEARLEDLIRIGLPCGEIINERARLSYHQKLIVVQGLGILKSREITALDALNKVRNEFAHKIDRELTLQDVLRIGNSFGKEFEEIRQKAGSDTVVTLKCMLGRLCGYLDGLIHGLEHIHESLTITKKKSP